jgi:hypothetical protein
MPFETLAPRLQAVATSALALCRQRFGQNGLKTESEIHPTIPWRPTFFVKQSRYKLIAVEIDDNIYPEILKIAAHDIGHHDFPIAVYQGCSLEAYQLDTKHTKVNLLKRHGFGLITVDDAGHCVIQHAAVPLAQHISPEDVERELSGLTPTVKVAFRSAHDTYLVNEGQGLQQAGQIVEGLVRSLAIQAEKEGLMAIGKLPLATIVDHLWALPKFAKHRAALGGTREFVSDFRNVASHPANSAKAAAEKIRKCKAGFLDAMKFARKLREVAQEVGYRITIYVT